MSFRFLPLFAILFLSGCGNGTDPEASGDPVVYVPVPPYAGLVESLAGEFVQVRSVASENDDPHTYSPTPKELAEISSSQLYLTADLPFEITLAEKLETSRSSVKVVSLVENLERRTFAPGEHDHCDHDHGDHDHDHAEHDHGDHDHDHAEHDHGDHDHDHAEHDHGDHDHDHAEHDHGDHDHDHAEHDHGDHDHDHAEHDHGDHDHDHAEHDHGDHDHDHAEHDHGDHDHDHAEHDHHGHDHAEGELDPHVWLSPALLVEQIRTIVAELEPLLDSETAKSALKENSQTLIDQIRETDRDLAEKLAPHRGQSFYVYHGAFGYFADAYGLKQVPVELSGRSPEPRQIAALIDQAKEEGVSVIFVQPQFDQKSAEAIAQSIEGTVVSIDPLAKDVLKNLKHIGNEIAASVASE